PLLRLLGHSEAQLMEIEGVVLVVEHPRRGSADATVTDASVNVSHASLDVPVRPVVAGVDIAVDAEPGGVEDLSQSRDPGLLRQHGCGSRERGADCGCE